MKGMRRVEMLSALERQSGHSLVPSSIITSLLPMGPDMFGEATTAPANGVLMSSVPQRQHPMSLPHNIVHSITPIKNPNPSGYPLHLQLGGPLGPMTTTVNVQIPGSSSNIVHPVQLNGPTVSLPLGTNVPVQLPGGGSINVPLQFPGSNQNIQLPSMPLLQNANAQNFNSPIIHVHMGSNQRTHSNTNMSEPIYSTSQVLDNSVKMTNSMQVQNPMHMQMPNSQSSGIQLQLAGGNTGPVQLRNSLRVPQVVYIQTPSGLKQVASSEVINTASSSGTAPHIIMRRPVNTTPGIQFVNAKANLTSKGQLSNKSSILAPGNSAQPIVIQKSKQNTIVPVSIAATGGKPAFAYLSTVKKATVNKTPDNSSILIPNNQISTSTNNQKVFLTPVTIPKIQSSKYILPMSTMASKGPIINLQIANGQLQNDSQGNITVMRDSNNGENAELPPLQPLGKSSINCNSKDVPQSPKNDKPFTISIPGSRAEPTGEHEYTLSIPETNASMNDDIYTVSIADDDDEGSTKAKSFTLSIPEKGKSLLTKTITDKHELPVPAAAVLRRSNSENIDKNTSAVNLKRRISLCTDILFNKKNNVIQQNTLQSQENLDDSDNNDDHRVPSLFCDEKLDKELDAKGSSGEQESEEFKVNNRLFSENRRKSSFPESSYSKRDIVSFVKKDIPSRAKRESTSVDSLSEEDPPGLLWNNGMAQLSGSNLQFQTNEFGLIDVIDNSDPDDGFIINASSKYHTPLKQRSGGREKKPTSPEDLYCCDGCGCHGMAAEFVTPNFCSLTCQRDFRKVEQKKKEKEKTQLIKKRNRMKKLLMQKQRIESGLFDQVRDGLTQSETEARLLSIVKTEDDAENEKYPWMCGESGFSWMKYLEFCKAKAAPVKCFKDPFPYNKNGFKVGMKLEAIDPTHPSAFCVVTVAETQGYRMRLHFDGYPEIYDFWINADSIDIFPPGWCEKNGRELKPPMGFQSSNFSWALYLKQARAIAAPRHLFPHMCTTMVRPNGFRTLMKLEAEDKKNKLICVATVADVLDNRILINFDSWDDIYDYWVDPASPWIHPVGWAEENGHSLTPPNFYKDPDSFTWEGYLCETGAQAVPARAFKPRPPQGFRVGMKLEVVDQRVPFLIRVATISEVREHLVRVSFDGWPDSLSYWLDDDSPDLHPVGWCLKTGHPLEPPITEEELRVTGPCGVGGCRGLGSLLGGVHKTHSAAALCPYSHTAVPTPPDRIAAGSPETQALLPRPKTNGRPPKFGAPSIPESTEAFDSDRESRPLRGRPPKHKRIEEITKSTNTPVSDEESNASSARSKRSRQEGAAERAPGWSVMCVDVTAALARLVDKPQHWTKEQVREFVLSAGVNTDVAGRFIKHHITGPDFLMLSQAEMVDIIGLKLGPAIKIYSMILQLRKRILS